MITFFVFSLTIGLPFGLVLTSGSGGRKKILEIIAATIAIGGMMSGLM